MAGHYSANHAHSLQYASHLLVAGLLLAVQALRAASLPPMAGDTPEDDAEARRAAVAVSCRWEGQEGLDTSDGSNWSSACAIINGRNLLRIYIYIYIYLVIAHVSFALHASSLPSLNPTNP